MRTLILMVMALSLTACATIRTPHLGILYTDATYPVAVTSNQTGNRVGESCTTSWFGLVNTGDASVETARRNGGITLVASVDEQATSYVVYSKYCTIVRGR